MPPTYILISGKRYTGKDFIAKLINEFQKGSQVIHFADAVKYIYAERKLGDMALGTRLIHDREFKELHRKGLIELSQSEKVHEGDDIWVKRLIEIHNSEKIYIVPDLRFKAEINSSALTGRIIKINVIASEETRKNRGWIYDKEIDTHSSEVDLDEFNSFDYIIKNEGDITENKDWLHIQSILKELN